MSRRPLESLLLAAGLMAATPSWPQAAAPNLAPQAAPDSDLSLADLLRQSLPDAGRRAEVSTASRFAQRADQAPTVTYVLTDEDIRSHGMRNLADVLNALPGLFTTYNGSFSFIAARGLGRPADFNARLLLLIDGMRANENIYDAALVDEFQIDVELIERVEFAPGPGSALYGNNAFFGVINVITKRADKLGGAQVRASAGSDRVGKLLASYGRRLDEGGEWWLALSASDQNRIRLPVESLPGEREALLDRNSERFKRLVAAWSRGGWHLRAGLTDRLRLLPFAVSHAQPRDFGTQVQQSRLSFASLRYQGELGPDWDWELHLSTQRSLYHSDTPTPLEYQLGDYRARALGRWHDAELLLGTQRWTGQRWIAGLALHHDRLQELSYGLRDHELDQLSYGKNRNAALFLQDEIRLGERQQLVLGWRYDHSEYFGHRANPRLAWNWRPDDNSSLKLQHGSAFRNANLFEFDTNNSLGAGLPRSERIRTTELAWDQSLGDGLRYSASVYRSRMLDLITPGAEIPDYQNAGPTHAKGLELGLDKQWQGGTRLNLALSLQHTHDEQDRELSNSPTRLLKARLSLPLAPGWQLGWQMLAMSRRETSVGPLAGHVIHHLNLGWELDAATQLGIGLYNATDTRFFDRTDPFGPPLQQERRTLRIQLTRRFP
ncbi:TonB-dependent receptor [Pelomonas sp. V22]|uniref:TonB-dependent receptor plug domain-containing protein n=1 Tax=Pelomonas sp. V22 TaxID=2822139 RepID=UPI0024A9028B|nr:TonB-dependent receptor [Pelomonas sp. V22]MDI4633817.1 TonB-dependent receptor [Pelomonas sp. V22]